MTINEKKQKVLAALLVSPTKESAAASAGVSTKTVSRYLRDAEFAAAYKSAAADVMNKATRRLQGNLTAAIDRLGGIVANDDEISTNQISAARTLLDFSLKFTEFNDIVKKLNELEEWRDEIDEQKR